MCLGCNAEIASCHESRPCYHPKAHHKVNSACEAVPERHATSHSRASSLPLVKRRLQGIARKGGARPSGVTKRQCRKSTLGRNISDENLSGSEALFLRCGPSDRCCGEQGMRCLSTYVRRMLRPGEHTEQKQGTAHPGERFWSFSLQYMREAVMPRVLDIGELAQEYDAIKRQVVVSSSWKGSDRRNVEKNRYLDVIPYDFNLVRTGAGCQYINASHLQSSSGDVVDWSYIATQGPLAHTVADFWQMVFEQEVGSIVMLTRCIEGRTHKCSDYMPPDSGEAIVVGGFRIRVVKQKELSNHITHRVLEMEAAAKGAAGPSHQTQHYYYHEWPDHGVPNDTYSLRRLSRALEENRKLSSAPVLVHCSAGVGRTGVFCVVDVILRRLRLLARLHSASASTKALTVEQVQAALDMRELVLHLRNQRMGMVQTINQYLFCHQVVLDELESKTRREDMRLARGSALTACAE